MTWWSKSSDEQKLRQIDAAISLKMNGIQCAMNLRTTKANVYAFASKHGRHFNAGMTLAQKEDLKRQAARKGRRNIGAPETIDRDAFSIFDPPKPERLFSKHPHDEE